MVHLGSIYQKFPKLNLNGKQIIWDLRQDINDVPVKSRRVYVKSFLPTETKSKLLQIPAAEHVVEGLPEFQLGKDSAQALDNPSLKLKILAVTGTNGKTTTATMLGQLLSKTSQKPIPVIGTLGLLIFENGKLVQTFDTGFTTPEAPSLQAMLAEFLKLGWSEVVMEASSQGLSLGRLSGTKFFALGFTNLTQDHLDFHKTMEAYAAAKVEIFKKCLHGLGVLHESTNQYGSNLVKDVTASLQKRAIVVNFQKDFQNVVSGLEGHGFDFESETYFLPLVGQHNLENFRVVLELFRSTRGTLISPQTLKDLMPARGRLELVGFGERKFVYVDYAHTPDALDKSLQSLKTLKEKDQKLWVIFGCGGDRDPTKRPQMGKIAESLADNVIVTSDNPRTESPELILNQIVGGMRSPPTMSCVDRREAIRWALKNMKARDILLIAGKGHEEYQIIGTQKYKFSDSEEVKLALNQIFTLV